MGLDRRTFLEMLGAGAAGAVLPAAGRAAAPAPRSRHDAVGMLYDSTRCIGCRACVTACRRANDLPPETRRLGGGVYDAPDDLSDRTKTVIRLARRDGAAAFCKVQCMHCLEPACVSVCMLGALKKREGGIVAYDPDRCIGCRYCQVACPFGVPRFQWHDATPLIVKCELCRHLLARGREPACCAACPRRAVIFGRRADLLADARERLARHPGRYHPDILGDTEVGGTQVLVLAPAGFTLQDLGYPDLDDRPIPALSETVQHGIYRGFVAPVVLYGLLAGALWRHRRHDPAGGDDDPDHDDREVDHG